MFVPEKIEELILAELAGECTLEEEEILKQWCRVSAENQKLYNRFCSLWYMGVIGGQKDKKREEVIWQEIERRHRHRVYRRLSYWASAAAVCLVLSIGGYRIWKGGTAEQSEVETIADLLAIRQIEPVKLILSSGREVNIQGEHLIEHDAGAVIRTDSVGLIYSAAAMQQEEESVYNELVIPKCGEYRLVLSDGTSVMLNAETKLRFPVKFAGDVREVWLEGEAFFDVKTDERCPFIVHVENAAVKVLGTSFNIMAYRVERHTEITLVRGSVDVCAAGRHELLVPGNQVALDHTTLQMSNRKVNVAQYIAWKDGILRFDDLTLEQLMNRLSRWYDIQFEFSREELKGKLFSGGFKKYENLERILEMIQETNDVRFVVQNNKIEIEEK